MSVCVLGREELAAAGIALLSLEQLAVVGVGLCKGWMEPFEVAENLSVLHHATVVAFAHAYGKRGEELQAAQPLEIMCEIGRLLGIRDEPIEGSVQGQYVWEWYDKNAVHELAWRYMQEKAGAVKQARRSAWSLVYNALDNAGHCHMTDKAREIALYVCQALLVVDDD